MTARFVRTQKEMEGRYEDVWALVDEADDVQSWTPDDELTVVGKPAPRLDGTRAGDGPRALHGRRDARGNAPCGRAALARRAWAGALARPRRSARGRRVFGR